MATAELRCATSRIVTITHASASAATVGDILLANTRVLVAYDDLAADEAGEWIIQADELLVPKVGSQAWTEGDVVYWDDTAKNFTKTTTSNTKCGFVLVAAGSADTTGLIKLDNSINM